MIVMVCSAIIRRDNLFLMVKEFKPGIAGKWNLPGGKLEEGESIYDAVIREVREETGFAVTRHTLISIINKPRTSEGNTVVRFIFLCDASEQPNVSAEHEHDYLSVSELEKLARRDMVRGKEILPLLKAVVNGTEWDRNNLIQTM